MGLNAQKIEKLVKEKYNKDIKIKHVQKILDYFRNIIYIHMKLKYETTLIGGFDRNLNQK